MVFCGDKAMKTIRVNEGNCKLLPWLIYFVVDKKAYTETPVSRISFVQDGNEMSMSTFADDELEDT